MSYFTIHEVYEKIFGIGEFATHEKVISYLIVGNEYAILFDTGIGLYSLKECIMQITLLPVIVINSHTHYDHIGNNCEFDRIWMYDHFLSRFSTQGLSHAELIAKPYETPEYFPNGEYYKIKPFVVEKFLTINDQIHVGPYTFSIIHVPGHAPDCIALYEKNHQLLFAGDVVYDGTIYLQLPESSPRDYIQTIRTLSEYPYKYIFGGHNTFLFPLCTMLSLQAFFSQNVSEKMFRSYQHGCVRFRLP